MQVFFPAWPAKEINNQTSQTSHNTRHPLKISETDDTFTVRNLLPLIHTLYKQ